MEIDYWTHYLISYDISDNKRSNLIRNILRSYCWQQQYSVYEGQLTHKQIKDLIGKIKKIINPKNDNILIYPLSKRNIFSKTVFGKLKYRIQRTF